MNATTGAGADARGRRLLAQVREKKAELEKIKVAKAKKEQAKEE